MSRSLTSCLALLTLGIVSCRGGAPADDRGGGSPTSPRPADQASAATQLDLAHELDALDHVAEPSIAIGQLRDRWQGRQLTWTVTRQAALCATADRCNVVPFATRPDGVQRQGWLPRLGFAPGQFERLTAACAGASMCQLTFRGRLATLALSPDLPTSLDFADVSIVTATAALPAAPQHAGG